MRKEMEPSPIVNDLTYPIRGSKYNLTDESFGGVEGTLKILKQGEAQSYLNTRLITLWFWWHKREKGNAL